MRPVAGGILTFVLAAPIACDSPTAPLYDPGVAVPDVSPYVTAELAMLLDDNGRFDVSWDCDAAQGDTRGIASSEELAVAVARRYLSGDILITGTVGPLTARPTAEVLAEQHGHAIDWPTVRAGVRATLCAESILEPMPDTLHPAVLNFYGPAYLVPLYVEWDQVAVVSVAARSSLYLTEEGLQNRFGNELRFGAAPHGHAYGSPTSPEAAVRHASRETGARIARLPRLLKPGHEIVAYEARWELVLDRRISCARVTDGYTLDVDTVYAGLYPSFTDPVMRSGLPMRLFVQDTVQPTEVMVRNVGDKGELELISWPLRPGVAVDFWEVDCQA